MSKRPKRPASTKARAVVVLHDWSLDRWFSDKCCLQPSNLLDRETTKNNALDSLYPIGPGGRHEVFLFGIPFDLLGGKLLDSIFSGV